MHSPLLMILVLAGVGALIFGTWWFSPYQRTLRALRGVPRVSISEAVEGSLVRIVGTLRAGPRTLHAPLSGRGCACFRVEVDQRVSHGKRSRWRSLIRAENSVDFVVEDATGRAIVKGGFIETAIVLDHHQRSGTFNNTTPELDAFLARHGHASTSFFGFNKRLRYREGVLEPGEIVALVGRARWEDDPEPGAIKHSSGNYRETARRKRLVLEPGTLGPVRASDDPSAICLSPRARRR